MRHGYGSNPAIILNHTRAGVLGNFGFMRFLEDKKAPCTFFHRHYNRFVSDYEIERRRLWAD
ncbi:hypothetical protein [Cytobacillus oceanisediminis]|uniref:hypothetical protein n=1 Tax=Cytobacillus oceanisediminis TaxID=665099 RepID=UPI002494DFE5|nr:hypothetical protein [Cytobacillus oceanisediminis]